MNKFFLCFAFVLLIITNGTAQEEKITFGIKTGVNVATLTGDFSDELGYRTGFHIGGLVEIPLLEKFALQPEIIYSTQGASNDFEDGDLSEEITIRLDYLNIPVMAKYYIIEGLSVQAGPQLGILLSAEQEIESSFENSEEDLKDFISSIDLGFNFGVGYQLHFGLFFEARYNQGITNINDDFDEGNQNSLFQFSVGYKF